MSHLGRELDEMQRQRASPMNEITKSILGRAWTLGAGEELENVIGHKKMPVCQFSFRSCREVIHSHVQECLGSHDPK